MELNDMPRNEENIMCFLIKRFDILHIAVYYVVISHDM
ncbi:hypothetical protein BSSX_2913 [Bacillus subtilis]|nr:hypothetical protein BSSX_2913 [Bacillus subtilis]